jgi:GATA-binding protein 2
VKILFIYLFIYLFLFQTNRPASMKKDGIQTRNRKLSAKTKKGLNRAMSGMSSQDMMKPQFDKNQFRFSTVPGLTGHPNPHGMMAYPSNMASYSHYSLHPLAHTQYGQLQGGMDHFGGGSAAMLQTQQSGYSTFPNGQGNFRDISRALR